MLLATNAACDDFPPSLVKIPLDGKNAGTSSGLVTFLTRIILSLGLAAHISIALLTSKTAIPFAAPGAALIPFASFTNFFTSFLSIIGCSNSSNCSAGILVRALFLLMNFSLTKSTEVLHHANAVIFAVLVCKR